MLSPQILADKTPDLFVWAQGLVALPRPRLVYAGVANLALLVVHSYDESGRIKFVSRTKVDGASLPCWVELSRDRRFLYTGNAGNNTMSVFDISRDPRHPRQLQTLKLKRRGNPWNFTVDPTGRFIFLVDMRAVGAAVPAGQGNELHTLAIGRDGRLSERRSPVRIPVPVGTNPWGIAVAPH
jgi:DNA-binding beta-propeller fold protein YncE